MTSIVVQPVRFTDHLDEMRRFLEVLGLRARIESERGGWVDMVAGAGMVGLHSAADSTSGAEAGETRLSFEVDDVHTLAEQLRSVDLPDVTVYDEAYAQVLTCTDPLGDSIMVNGRSRDLYGYTLHQAHPDERWKVMPVRFTAPQGPYAGFLEQFGLARQGAVNDYYVIYAGHCDAGQIGLHFVYDGELPIVPGPAAVQLTFETTEPVEEVAERLDQHGYDDVAIATEDFGSVLSVTDPDGRPCQVHEPAREG